ncbi:predicted protein [Nematostella vectensis]|uniref:Glutamine amidotransferase domain-containing protein n=3 Tax=Nematostella vectensis TaxID=45351 RepID=A7SPR8_NEMVE|nr:predicted protein [Nematostella vectensis]|eukprot:XP_001626403.1 predicted protein [Nematostella vectensis]
MRSLDNALNYLGYRIRTIKDPKEIASVDKLILPGVGAFGSAMKRLQDKGFVEPLQEYIKQDRPFIGICLGMQMLFSGSEEFPDATGLGVIPTQVKLLKSPGLVVPHMGWNGMNIRREGSPLITPGEYNNEKVYFVHSFAAPLDDITKDWALATTTYGNEFVCMVNRGNIAAMQFHPEKSGAFGLQLLKNYLTKFPVEKKSTLSPLLPATRQTELAKRVITSLNVRTNNMGELVATKGEQFEVREIISDDEGNKPVKGDVKAVGDPVELGERFFSDGADEIAFLNITSFRSSPIHDLAMLKLLRKCCERIFVPFTVGGGIRDIYALDPDSVEEGKPVMRQFSALEVAAMYFKSGADKVSVASDAVYAAEEFIASGHKKTGKTSIEKIAERYGRQAVVLAVDTKTVYVPSPDSTKHHTVKARYPGPNGEKYVWWQCTVKGGRETRDVGAYELVKACEELGAGEILLNNIDRDGTNHGYDLDLVKMVKGAVSIPVIASSGAGHVSDFVDLFRETNADGAMAGAIFHRGEVDITDVKEHLRNEGFTVRL